MRVLKDAHLKFQVEHVDNINVLQHLKVTVGELQLFSISRLEVVEQSETMIVSSSDVQFYPKDDWD